MNRKFDPPTPRVLLWGGTGQAKVVRPILEGQGGKVVAVIDDTPGLRSPFPDVPIFQGKDGFQRFLENQPVAGLGFVVAIGNPHGRVRLRLHDYLAGHGLSPVTVVHPTAWVEDNAQVGEGCQLMAGSFVLAEARVGRQCILNTKASADHEDILEDGVELGPGATLCGLVHCGVNAWVCTGATVLPRIRIGDDAVVGGGALVRTDVPAGATVVGIPAKQIARGLERSHG
jgi:sugar O-acyltransferase (sialic acid O-acetyltransferase NeuD family)